MSYYCEVCKDTLCVKCADFPWECPEGITCKSCLKELKILKELWVSYLKEKHDSK